jgi:subtilisin family serine protease
MKRILPFVLASALALGACNDEQEPTTGTTPGAELATATGTKPINVVTKSPVTNAQLAQLAKYGTVLKQIREIKAVVMNGRTTSLAAIRALPFVAGASFDAVRNAPPGPAVPLTDFTGGFGTWNTDAVNVAQAATPGHIAPNGEGVYVAILDTGLMPTWRQYFPAGRIATEFAKSFGGGGQDRGNVSEQPHKWEHDVNAHGTHVTSIVLGYSLDGTPITGVAPRAKVIPVKVLNQNGSGWSSVIAQGIVYIANLKIGALSGSPIVINMSLGGPNLDVIEKAAIDYAVSKGVVIVASAGNSGPTGAMGYPGAYTPVISVAALGVVREWTPNNSWWLTTNTADPTDPTEYYVADFSALRTGDQDLDVAAPGSWVVGPWQENQGGTNYFFVGGTSQAAPHVTGLVALMLQKSATLGVAAPMRAGRAEQILTSNAIQIPDVNQQVRPGPGADPETPPSWDSNRSGAGLVTADKVLAATP